MTSGTIFASRKLGFTDLPGAIAIFINAVKRVSALPISRDLCVQYKAASSASDQAKSPACRWRRVTVPPACSRSEFILPARR